MAPRKERSAVHVSSEPSGGLACAMGWSPLGPMETWRQAEGGPRTELPPPRRPAGGTGRSGPLPETRPTSPPAPESTAGSPSSTHLSTPPFAFPTALRPRLTSLCVLERQTPMTSHPGSLPGRTPVWSGRRRSRACVHPRRLVGAHCLVGAHPLPPTKRAFSRGGDLRESLSAQVRCSRR